MDTAHCDREGERGKVGVCVHCPAFFSTFVFISLYSSATQIEDLCG